MFEEIWGSLVTKNFVSKFTVDFKCSQEVIERHENFQNFRDKTSSPIEFFDPVYNGAICSKCKIWYEYNEMLKNMVLFDKIRVVIFRPCG